MKTFLFRSMIGIFFRRISRRYSDECHCTFQYARRT